MIDEAKRILGNRFPRGFQDNIFALLYGGSDISPYCSIVFAGAQELYRFCEDDTSPIGSRAAKHFIVNLTLSAVEALLGLHNPSLTTAELQTRGGMLFDAAGGHAGITARLAQQFAMSRGSAAEATAAITDFTAQYSELFHLWTASLSQESRTIQDSLIVTGQLTIDTIPRLLREQGLDPSLSNRACEELTFTGIATRDGEVMIASNSIYRELVQGYAVAASGSKQERTVWALIEATELSLRGLVAQRFRERWSNQVDDKVKQVLGDAAWGQILSNKSRHERSYPRSVHKASDNILDFVYLGQLVQLMLWDGAWSMFKGMFRDKRELEDIVRDIGPVRNDHAHFRAVPARELDRCNLRCQDLLFIIESHS